MSLIPARIGKYRVDRSLGEGGMGSVYLAHDTAIERDVAIKLLRVDDDEMRSRFRAEAQSAGRLKHPNIVTVYDYGDFEGRPCIVMEYVQGDTISSLIRRGDPIPDVKKLRLMEQVCRGLAYAHRCGIVHRDIKPSNLMVEHDETIKIVDFGIARGSAQGLTRTGRMVGTLAYMSPEQVRGETVDRRSDIFSVGLVLYEFLSGQYAFPGDSDFSIYNRIATGTPQPFTHPDLELCELAAPVITKALARSPADRYQDAQELGAAIGVVRKRLEATQPAAMSSVVASLPSRPPMRTPHAVRVAAPARETSAATATSTVRIGPETGAAGPTGRATRRSIHWAVAGSVAALVTAVTVWAILGRPSLPTRSGPVQEIDRVQPPSGTPSGEPAPPAPRVADPAPAPAEPTPKAPPAPVAAASTTPRTTTPSQTRAVGDPRIARAAQFFDDGDYASAAATYNAILSDDPGSKAAQDGLDRVRRAQLAEQRVLATPARRTLTVAETRQLESLLTDARRLQSEGEYDAAIAKFDAVLKIDANNADAVRGLGETKKAKDAEAAVLKGRLKKPGA